MMIKKLAHDDDDGDNIQPYDLLLMSSTLSWFRKMSTKAKAKVSKLSFQSWQRRHGSLTQLAIQTLRKNGRAPWKGARSWRWSRHMTPSCRISKMELMQVVDTHVNWWKFVLGYIMLCPCILCRISSTWESAHTLPYVGYARWHNWYTHLLRQESRHKMTLIIRK